MKPSLSIVAKHALLIPLISLLASVPAKADPEMAFEAFEVVLGTAPRQISKLTLGFLESQHDSSLFTLGGNGSLFFNMNNIPPDNESEMIWFNPSGHLRISLHDSGDDGIYVSGKVHGAAEIGAFSHFVLGSDGNFYGHSIYGGANNVGRIFVVTNSYNPGNHRHYGSISTLKDFTAEYENTVFSDDGPVYPPLGQLPVGGIVEVNPGYFYGATPYGGTYSNGTVYAMTSGGLYTLLHSFDGTNGAYPAHPMITNGTGVLYGTTLKGGAAGEGAVFKITTNGTFTFLHSFVPAADGGTPGGLVRGSDGDFYGTTSSGGANGSGTFFKITSGDAFVKITDFSAANGMGGTVGALVQGTNDNFYGISGEGTFYQLTPGGSVTIISNLPALYSDLYEFEGPTPVSGLTQTTNGSIFGITEYGMVYRYFPIFAPVIQDWSHEGYFYLEELGTNTYAAGSDVGFAGDWWVKADGGNLTYQWQKDGTNLVNDGHYYGVDTHSLAITNMVGADNGAYSVIVSNSLGWTNLLFIHVVVVDPTFLSLPSNVTVNYGQTATFSATAQGTGPLSYQWKKNGIDLVDGGNIGGAATPNLTVSNVSFSDAGNYSLVVSNALSNTVASATLTVNDPGILTQPVSQIAATGSNAIFSVSAASSGLLSYQWKKGATPLVDGGDIAGAQTAALTLFNVDDSDEGGYSVVVTNASGTVTSSTANLIVRPVPVITSQPVGATNVAGGAVSFSVTATGEALQYQWKRDGNNLGNNCGFLHFGTTVCGAQTATLTLSTLAADFSGEITVEISNGAGTVTSISVPLAIVSAAPQITIQPVNQTNGPGTTAAFAVSATGGGLSYQWRKNGTPLSNGGRFSGVKTSALTIAVVEPGDAANYTVTITNLLGTVTSDPATLTIDPVIISQPASLTNNEGATATFSVSATGTALTYQWRKGLVDLSDGGDVSGATQATLTLSNIGLSDAGNYSVVASSTFGSATSVVAVLTVATPPSIDVQPLSITNNAGTTATFTVTASGTAPVYQWMKNGTPLTNGGRFSGVTTSALTITGVGGADAANYTVSVTNIAATVISDPASLTVIDPYIITQPAGQALPVGGTLNMSVSAAGTGLTYQWRTNGVNISGAMASNYTKTSVQLTNAANYTVVVTGTYGSLTSAVAVVTVDPAIKITKQPAAQANKVVGQIALFSVTATGGSFQYQWKIGPEGIMTATNIPGATSTSFSINPIDDSYIGASYVYVTITSGSYSTNSAGALFTVIPDPSDPPKPAIILPANNASYQNNSYTMTINGTATDNARVENVFISINDAAFVPATLNSNGPSILWSTNITTVPGTNKLEVYSVDYSGRVSPVTTVKFFDNHWSSFQLLISATGGDVVPPNDWFMIQSVTNAAMGTNNGLNPLLVGRPYKLTIKQNFTNGYIFTNWTFTSLTNGAPEELQSYTETNTLVLNYVMRSNMVLTANFVTNNFRLKQGSYNGLFAEVAETRQRSAGYISIKTTEKFSFSGKLLVDGNSVGFSGKFNINGTTNAVAKRYKSFAKSDLTVQLALDIAGDSQQITGNVIDVTNGWTAPFTADRVMWGKMWDGTVNPATVYSNAYTWVLPGFASTNDGPTGWSYASAIVNTNGQVKTTVTTADGQAFTQITYISTNADIPFHATFYKDNLATNAAGASILSTRGTMMGWLSLETDLTPIASNYAPTGEVTWIKTGWTNTSWTAGFTNNATNGVPIIGSVHNPLLSPIYSTLPATNFLAVMSEGALVASSFTNVLFLKSPAYNNFGVKMVNHKFTASLTKNTGIAGGTFTNDVTPISTIKWGAAMLQDYNQGFGYFMNTTPGITNGGGKVTIELEP